jgi:hypothetical protein
MTRLFAIFFANIDSSIKDPREAECACASSSGLTRWQLSIVGFASIATLRNNSRAACSLTKLRDGRAVTRTFRRHAAGLG